MKLNLKEAVSDILAYLLQVERRKLLWENSSPTSPFAAQTISLDLTGYDAVDVEFRHWTNKDCRVTTRNYLNEGEGTGIGTSTDASSYGNFRRGFKMLTDGVQFWGGTSNSTVDNNSTIPVRIWGVKSGGVLRNPVIARLSAIFKIGGGLSEHLSQRNNAEANKQDIHSRQRFIKWLDLAKVVRWYIRRLVQSCQVFIRSKFASSTIASALYVLFIDSRKWVRARLRWVCGPLLGRFKPSKLLSKSKWELRNKRVSNLQITTSERRWAA